jgi:hypothetical protein
MVRSRSVGLSMLYDCITKVKSAIAHLRQIGMSITVWFSNFSLDVWPDGPDKAPTYVFDFDVTDKLDFTPLEWVTWLKQR